jgi:hypothetical protein
MPEYYLDIETTGLDPRSDRIITIQYQKLAMVSGRTEGPLTILKEWESSERGILELFLPILLGSGPFSFVAIGFNIPFVYTFILERARAVGLDPPDPVYLIGRKPYLDLKPFAVLMNNGSFKGASLDRFTSLTFSGDIIPKLYEAGDHDRIVSCIEEEAREFQALYRHLKGKASILIPETARSKVKRPASED